MFRKTGILFIGCIILTACNDSAPTVAEETEDQLVDQIVEAYGGETLLQMQTWLNKSKHKMLWPDSYRTPNIVDNRDVIYVQAFDNTKSAGSFELWQRAWGIYFHTYELLNEGQDHINEENHIFDFITQEKQEANPFSIRLSLVALATPVLLAKRLAHQDTIVKILDREVIDGKTFDVLQVTLPRLGNDYVLYVDAETHLIAKATAKFSDTFNRGYLYSNYREQDGITVAGNVRMTDEYELFTSHRDLYDREFSFNLPVDEFLVPPTDYDEFKYFAAPDPNDFVDQSKMTANKISDSVYHVGQGAAYSIFIDAGDYVIASGGYPGVKDRLQAYREASGVDKPLGYQIVTHHHIDHISGLPEAYELGAQLVTVQNHVEKVKAVFSDEVNDNRFVLISGSAVVGADAEKGVEVYDISTDHAEQLLLVYVRDEKLIFIPDHFGSPFKTGLPTHNENHKLLADEIKRLGLDVEKISRAHGSRIFSIDDLLAAAAQPAPSPCHNNRPICVGIDWDVYRAPYFSN